MSFVDPSTLVQLNALMGSEAYPVGTYASPVNLSAAITESDGLPLGWWVRGPVAGTISAGLQKAGGQALTVTEYGVATSSLTAPAAAGTFSWSDGPVGHVTGTADQHVQQTDDVANAGDGFSIEVPCPVWPDWQILRAYSYDGDARGTQFIASINDTLGSTASVSITKNNFNAAWSTTKPIVTQVKFCATEPGRTFKYQIEALYSYYLGLQAVQLFKAKKLGTRPRGFARALMLTGYIGRLGAR